MPNAIITCRLCARRYDKGCEADPTQNDDTFVCAECGVTAGGYPQNGYINPAVLRADTQMTPAPAPKKSLLKRLLGK